MKHEDYLTDDKGLIYLDSLKAEGLTFKYVPKWTSKYNSYVVYDYEPFCADGFYVSVDLEGDESMVNYVVYLCDKRKEGIENIKRCFNE